MRVSAMLRKATTMDDIVDKIINKMELSVLNRMHKKLPLEKIKSELFHQFGDLFVSDRSMFDTLFNQLVGKIRKESPSALKYLEK